MKGEKPAGICNISKKMLKAEGEAMIHELHAMLSDVWQFSAIPPD